MAAAASRQRMTGTAEASTIALIALDRGLFITPVHTTSSLKLCSLLEYLLRIVPLRRLPRHTPAATLAGSNRKRRRGRQTSLPSVRFQHRHVENDVAVLCRRCVAERPCIYFLNLWSVPFLRLLSRRCAPGLSRPQLITSPRRAEGESYLQPHAADRPRSHAIALRRSIFHLCSYAVAPLPAWHHISHQGSAHAFKSDVLPPFPPCPPCSPLRTVHMVCDRPFSPPSGETTCEKTVCPAICGTSLPPRMINSFSYKMAGYVGIAVPMLMHHSFFFVTVSSLYIPRDGRTQSPIAFPPSCIVSPREVAVCRISKREEVFFPLFLFFRFWYRSQAVSFLENLIVRWRAGGGTRNAPCRGLFTPNERIESDLRMRCQSCAPCCMYMYARLWRILLFSLITCVR